MTRKEAMELLNGKTTQELLNKQLFWQFQLKAIDEDTPVKERQAVIEKRRRELHKELSWIEEVIATRDDVKHVLSEGFGEETGKLELEEIGITHNSWDRSYYHADLYDSESVKRGDTSKHPQAKIIHIDDGKPPKQIIGMNTLDIKAKHGFEP